MIQRLLSSSQGATVQPTALRRRLFLAAVIFALILSAFRLTPFNIDTFTCIGVTDVSQLECEALVALYNATDGDNWDRRTNWLSSQRVADWYGVSITDNTVTHLHLSSNNLGGTIPAQIGNLANLEYLYLSNNHRIGGQIPPEIGNLSSLRILYLNGNELTGNIPSEIGNLNELTNISLFANYLEGNIPPELGSLANLVELDVGANRLSGTIPPEIGNLSQLQTLYVGGNYLSGPIPEEIFGLVNLTFLDISNNSFNMPIPSEIANLVNLRMLGMYKGQYQGAIPAEIGNLTQLTYLNLGYNELNGSIPAEIGNLVELNTLFMGNNNLSGSIPAEIGNLVKLETIILQNNGLNGPIPDEFGNLINLEYAWLGSNKLSGMVPQTIVALDKLQTFFVGFNCLQVPAEEPVASFLAQKSPGWDLYQGFDQYVDHQTGATVTALDGSTVVHVNAGVLPSDATFSFYPQEEPNYDTGALAFADNSFQLTATDVNGQPITLFEQPLIVEIFYDETKLGGIPENELAVYYWNMDEQQWLDIVTTCEGGQYTRDLEGNMFSVPLCHLSEFSLLSGGGNSPVHQHRIFLPLTIK